MNFHSQRFPFVSLLVLIVHGQSNQALTPAQDPNCTLTTNPDITGIGVRVSFYLQGLIVIFGPRVFEREQTENAFRCSILTAASLTVSAFIYGRTPGALSLVDALVVTILTFILSVGPLSHSYFLFQNPSRLFFFTYVLSISLIGSFGLLVWAHIDTYATIPGCNLNSSVKFVLFGHSLSATSRGLRGFALFYFSNLVFWGAIFFLCLLCLVGYSLLHEMSLAEKLKEENKDGPLLTGGSVYGIVFWVLTPSICAAWVVEVTIVEGIIRRNGLTHATNQWTYGQSLSMFLLVSPAYDFASAILKNTTSKAKTTAETKKDTAADIKDETQVEKAKKETVETAEVV